MAGMISVGEALETVMAAVPILPQELVPLSAARDRILATAVVSPLDLPTFANSAMDGFVLCSGDLASAGPNHPFRLTIVGEIPAGTTATVVLAAGEAMRIMTGARLPEGGNAVMPLEESDLDGETLVVTHPVPAGAHVRPAGEDLRQGEMVLPAGTVLTPPRLALLAAMGYATVPVFRRPRVAVLTTGNELVEPGQPLQPGQIYNSNAYALMAAIEDAGCLPERLDLVADDPDVTRTRLEDALRCDAVVSTGGVSVGDYDFVGRTLRDLGSVHFAKVAQQPGKPFTFATVGQTPFFALPGNPAAAMVAMEVYVRPALRRMMGDPAPHRPQIEVRLAAPVPRKAGRCQFLRAALRLEAEGPVARLTGPQGSGLIRAMAWADCLLVIPPGEGVLDAGETATAILLEPTAVCHGGPGLLAPWANRLPGVPVGAR